MTPPAIPLGASPWTRRLAVLLDTCITIPGTSIRIGLDPLLGLIPGLGDALSTLLGSALLLEALRCGLPRSLLLRLGGNLLLNALLGAIPGLGDLFSAWFKSNSRNYALLNSFLLGHPQPPPSPARPWLLAGALALLALLLACCFLIGWLCLLAWSALFHS